MKDAKIATQGLVNAALAFGYIAVVATMMYNARWIFGDGEDSVLAPIGFLLLFVVSAAVMAMLIFGKPVMLYVDGKKREGVMLLGYTVGSLAAIAVIFFAALVAMNQGMF